MTTGRPPSHAVGPGFNAPDLRLGVACAYPGPGQEQNERSEQRHGTAVTGAVCRGTSSAASRPSGPAFGIPTGRRYRSVADELGEENRHIPLVS